MTLSMMNGQPLDAASIANTYVTVYGYCYDEYWNYITFMSLQLDMPQSGQISFSFVDSGNLQCFNYPYLQVWNV